jgi:hypothetical protein
MIGPVGPRVALQIESVGGPRRDAALDVLETGQAAIGLPGLALSCDPATAHVGRRLPSSSLATPIQWGGGGHARERLAELASRELDRARSVVEEASASDARFAALVEQSDIIYEFVHDYGMGSNVKITNYGWSIHL